MRQSMRGRLLASTMICSVLTLGVGSAAMAADADQGQEVVVTGSRIPQPNLSSVSPLATVSDVELKAEGTVNVETLLNNMPQVFADFGANVSNGSTGTATVNLRNLGDQRTLVLVDGTRLMPGDPGFPVADLNTIPAALVERVDILTGGASATYGADAIAGVVNFIMKHDFEGVKLDAQYGSYQADNNDGAAHALLAAKHDPIPGSVMNGGTWDLAAVIGASSPDHKGNITAYATYTNLQPITEATRDYSACSISTGSPAPDYAHHICAGSSNSAFGRFTPSSGANAGQHFANNPAGGTNFVPYSSSTMSFNYAPFNYFQRSDSRYTGGYFAHYDINKNFNVYSNFMFSDDHTTAQIAPSGLFRGHPYNINCNNPFLTYNAAGTGSGNDLCSVSGATAGAPGFTPPTNTVGFDIGYRFAGFNRQDDLRHTAYRVNLGTKGDLVDGWEYDAYLQYGTAILAEQYLNDLSSTKIQNALLAGGTLAHPTCLGGQVGCVPLNIFSQGAITPAQFAYVEGQGFKEGSTTEQIASFNVTGDLGHYGLKSPFAKDGVGVALGTEYRRETLTEQFSSEFTSGDLTGQGGTAAPAGGSTEVREVFGEFRAPLAQDQQFAKLLQVTGGYRYSQYSGSVGKTDTYKLGLEWAPTDDIRFRAGYNRAVRAPNISNLFAAQTTGLFGGADPCAGGVSQPLHPTLYAACLATGLTAAQLVVGSLAAPQACPAGQCSALSGGNPALKPENADTYTYGFVFTPTFFHGFTLSVDYFDIKVNGLIGSVGGGPNVTVSTCATGGTFYCSFFHRGATGNIFGDGFIQATAANNGYLHTTGVDVESNYRFKLSDVGMGDWGSVNLNFVGTYNGQFVAQPEPGSATYDCAGLFGTVCGTPDPKWRHKLRVSWNTPWPLSVSGQWRYIGSVSYDGNSPNPALNEGVVNVIDGKIPSYSYFDISGTWKVNDKMTVRGGVNNVFSKNPPVLDSNNFPVAGPPFGNGNTYPQVYDSLGRFLFIGLTANF
jgi:iron complex outermembrane receptor protein